MNTPHSPKPTRRPDTGSEIIRGLKGMRDALAKGQTLPERFTMRTVELDLRPHDWTPREIVDLRRALRVSQGVFAQLIATSVKTVQSWEQGQTPPPLACRLLDCIKSRPEPWEQMLRDAVANPR